MLADVAFSDKITLDLGGITAQIFHTVSPHSEDTTCVYVPEEKVLFLGDATSEDFFNGGYMDKEKLESLIQMIRSTECNYCILSHCDHTVSPHSEDTTCVYVPEEKVLFLGDATSEDFFNGGYMDKEKLESLIQMIRSTECDYCILSHCEPLTKEGLLCYLESVL